MNIIITLFILLAVTFISLSANNLIAVTSSLDTYFEKAGVADYAVFEKGTATLFAEDAVKKTKGVSDIQTEEIIFVSKYHFPDKETDSSSQTGGTPLLSSIDRRIQKYFDQNNEEITEVEEGDVYVRQSVLSSNNAKIGDTVIIKVNDKEKKFTVKGILKDALFGSILMTNPRYLVSENDFLDFTEVENYQNCQGKMTFINTDDIPRLEKALAKCDSIVFSGSEDLIKFTYLMEMIIVAILLILSICLILISLVILKFTIGFTLSEEFREIGIMKAIGIHNRNIRALYIVKYFAMSLVGAVLGFVISVPLGEMLLKQTAQSIVMTNENGYLTAALCALAVVVIIMLFCYGSTRKIKKFTPIDAIRNGSTGKRCQKKGIIRLGKKPIRPVFFMAVNDIVTQARHFIIMIITFTIGLLILTIGLNMTTTLKSGDILNWISMTTCDAAMTDTEIINHYITADGREKLNHYLADIQNRLKDEGYDADCFTEAQLSCTLSKNEEELSTRAVEGINTHTDQYEYLEGTAPQNQDEIAVSYMIADKLHIKIGDKVQVQLVNEKKTYTVSAIYQTMMNLGENIRLYQGQHYSFENLIGMTDIQIRFADHPDESETNRRIELLKELYPDYDVKTASEFANYCIGVGNSLESVQFIVVFIVIVVNLLVAVLMEKSFLTKERSEIAMLKAIGFKNSSVVIWQLLRIAVIMLISTLLAIALSNPVGEWSVGAVFKMMGTQSIHLYVNVAETYILYPLITFAVTIFGVFLTALSVRKVNSNEINSIE